MGTTGTDAASPSTTAESDGYEPALDSLAGWDLVWHGAFFAIVVLAVLVALLDTDESWALRGWMVGVATLFAGWHGLAMLAGFNRHIRDRRALVVGHIAVSWGIWAVLVAFQDAYEVVAFGLLIQLFAISPIRWAITGCIALAALLIAATMALGSEGVGPWVLSALIPEAFLILVLLYLDAIDRQSAGRKRLIDELDSTRERLAATERQAGVLEERQRLAREIHDTLAQGFTSIVMHQEAADAVLGGVPESARRHLDQAQRTARESLGEARRMVWALTPEALNNATLTEAMRRVADRWSEEGLESAAVSVTGDAQRLHPSAEVTLLRTTQEALANVRKHAEASHVNVTLTYMDDQVTLDVQDDGAGFDPARPPGPGNEALSGFGLTAMRQRVEQLGGTLMIESAEGEGTTLVVEIPVHDQRVDAQLEAGLQPSSGQTC